MKRTTTILPPPSDIPIPMPETAGDSPESGEWRSLVELTKKTVRPGRAAHEETEAIPELDRSH